MENNELLLELNKINSITNELDRIIALKKFEKQYKTSKFYKQTKMPLKELRATLLGFRAEVFVETFLQNFNIQNLGNMINQVLSEIDMDNFEEFFNKLLQFLDPQQLKDAGILLQEQVKKIQP